MDLAHYEDAMQRLQRVACAWSRSAPHPYERQARHYQQMLDVIGARFDEWGYPSLTEEEQALVSAASESAELARDSHVQSLELIKVAIDILHPRMPKRKSVMGD
jgi:propanediol dehydratase large subunit